MLTKEECYKSRSDIKAFSILKNNSLALCSELHGVKILSLEACDTLQNISLEQLNYNTTAIAFSLDASLLAFANGTTLFIVDTQTKLLIQTIKTYEGSITLIGFVPQTKYIITGTKNGRVMQYRYDGRSHLSRLCSFGKNSTLPIKKLKNNYVSSFAFFEDIFAVSGYGGVITILQMNSYTKRYNINASKVRINTLCFLDKERLVSGSSDGVIKIHTLKKYSQTKSITTPFNEIHSIILMPNKNFIMVGGASEKLILIDITKAKIASTSYLSFSEEVSHLQLSHDKQLLVVLASREVIKVVLPTSEHLKSFILHNSLDKAYELIDLDPMLQGTREHKRVEVMYDKQYTKAIDALINSNVKEARKLLKSFSDIKSKKDDIGSIFKAFEFYPRFQTLCLDKKYSLAYAMAEKYPALKYTRHYKKMDEAFKDVFTYAQKQILMGRTDVAKEILSPYATVISKKSILNLVLKENENFIKFLKAITEKEYALVSQLLKTNENFAQIPSYLELEKFLQMSLKKIKRFINHLRTDDAVEEIKKLLNVPELKEELQDLYRDIKAVQKFQKHYETDDLKSCYEILDGDVHLEELELAKLLEKYWTKMINEAEECALKGDLKGIKKSFGPLLLVNTRLDKVGDLIRLSFHTKIKALIANKSFKGAQSIIYTYLDIFGNDSEIVLIKKMYEKFSKKRLALTHTDEKIISRNSWINDSLITQ